MQERRESTLVKLVGYNLENMTYVIQMNKQTVRYRHRRTGKHRGGLRVDIGDESRVRGKPQLYMHLRVSKVWRRCAQNAASCTR